MPFRDLFRRYCGGHRGFAARAIGDGDVQNRVGSAIVYIQGVPRDNACITPHIKHTKNFAVEHRDCACAICFVRTFALSFQVRIKELADTNKGKMAPEDYITLLPASPCELFASHPNVAKKLFDKFNLPVQCHPIPQEIAATIRSRIKLRPGRQPAQDDLQAPSGRPQCPQEIMIAGLRKPTRICMHACLITQKLR